MWVLLVACAAPCPRGLHADPDRTARLRALADGWTGAAVCYGRVEELGVRDAEGRALLDEQRPDALLAARLVHLGFHASDPAPSPDCERELLEEEALAWSTELALRVELGASDPTCPVTGELGPGPDVARVRDWLASSSHPLAASRRSSHRLRCNDRAGVSMGRYPLPEP